MSASEFAIDPGASSLSEIARAVLTPLSAPASFIHSQLLGPDLAAAPEDDDVDEWIVLDAAVATQIVAGGGKALLRWAAHDLAHAPHVAGLQLEAAVDGTSAAALEASVVALVAAIAAGTPIRAALAIGDTGIDCYRAAAAIRRGIGTALAVRARWDGPLDVKGAALALTFGADEIAGPLAPPKARYKLAQLGGPSEDSGNPSPAFVESLIQAAGRFPARRRP
jgi:hypothetical protein